MKHLLNISIGPVQEFIASARRCQDLWYGSWLLSELSKTVAEHLKSHGAESVVFPGGLVSAAYLDEKTSVANKILAVVPGGEKAVAGLACSAQKKMGERLEDLARAAFSQVYKDLAGPEIEEAKAIAWAQVQDMMEFQWVAVDVGGDYLKAHQASERLLVAVKNTRSWKQPSWGRPGWRKSSLDGVRESVIPESCFNNRQGRSKEEHDLWLYRQFRVKPTERLCGVGLLKRWGKNPAASVDTPQAFHSTSHVSAAPLRARATALASDPVVSRAWDAYKPLLEQAPFRGRIKVQGLAHALFGDFDGSILYPSRLRDIFFGGADSRRAEGPYADLCGKAELALGELLKALGGGEPNPHYALLLADGDRMGATIDAQESLERHQAISLGLDRFTQRVRDIVTEHGGSPIYSGGDDVLAMLPLHRCLDCAEALKDAFALEMTSFKTAEGLAPTLSVGLAIAHHLEDFADVRAWAKQAEDLAKRKRNSLALRLEKRGGSPVEACGTWDGRFLSRMRDWIELHRTGKVPNKLPFQWAELVRLARGGREMNELVMSDARRLLVRKDIAKAGMKDVTSLKETLDQMTEPAGLEALSAELVLAKEIERAQDQAMTPVPAKEVV